MSGWVRRWYRIAAAAATGVGLAALVLGATGQIFAPAVAPFSTKAVLSQDAGTNDPGTRATSDDAPRRCARAARIGNRKRARPTGRCRPARPKPGHCAVGCR